MAKRIRNNEWENDEILESSLKKHVAANLHRKEILDYMKRDFAQYAWCLRTLDIRLRHFDIYYVDKNVKVEEVRAAVQNEINGPGRLLGYRAMHAKIRLRYGLKVGRDNVYAVMTDIDPESLKARQPRAKAKKVRGTFSSQAQIGSFLWTATTN